MHNKIRKIREILNIPEGERIGQHIFNMFEKKDMFYWTDKEVIREFENQKHEKH